MAKSKIAAMSLLLLAAAPALASSPNASRVERDGEGQPISVCTPSWFLLFPALPQGAPARIDNGGSCTLI